MGGCVCVFVCDAVSEEYGPFAYIAPRHATWIPNPDGYERGEDGSETKIWHKVKRWNERGYPDNS